LKPSRVFAQLFAHYRDKNLKCVCSQWDHQAQGRAPPDPEASITPLLVAEPASTTSTSTEQPANAKPEKNRTSKTSEGAQLLELTPRQYEVLCLIAQGASMKSIARRLDISPATVKAHASLLYKRLNASSGGQAVFNARRLGATLEWDE